MSITIYHNPRCSKSRQTLALIQDSGVEPTVIEYLKTPPDAATLSRLLKALRLPARDLLRKGEAAYRELGLENPDLSEADLIDAMASNPILIERPIVEINGKAVLGRPPENVLALL
jgi:arsenate reductase